MKKFILSLFVLLVSGLQISYSQYGNEDKTSKTQMQTNVLKSMDITQQKIDLQNFDILKQIEPNSTSATIFNDQLLEGPINADNYLVGPNDIFSLGIWGVLNQPIPLSVSPEGSLIIPSVGEINIAGLTLKQAKEKTIAAVSKRFISANISLTLISPRRFVVTVTGIGQGTYPASSVMRASTLIAFVFSDSLSLSKSGVLPGEKGSFSLRSIQIKRKTGESIRVDLYKYFATQDDKYNPYLREGDVINLPRYQWEARFIAIQGAVQFPGVFEYVEGDDLETAFQLVRGLTTVANKDSVVIARMDPSASKMEKFVVSYEDHKNMMLEPNDRVMFMAKPDIRRDFRVYVLGEVVNPGYYPVTLNSTKLMDVIKDAGGILPNAYLNNSDVYRRLDTFFVNTRNRDSMETMYTLRLNDIVSNKDEKEMFESDLRFRVGRINVDFEKLFNGDQTQNIYLRDGDVVHIGDNKKQVYVYGQVNEPGYVPYKEGADYQYYINASGGYGERADKNEIRVIKFKTREWLDPEEAKIQSGDYVYVPKEIKRDFAYDIDLISKVASVIVSVITLTLLVIQSQK
jgi:polysaccharide biosynthesis/export protein